MCSLVCATTSYLHKRAEERYTYVWSLQYAVFTGRQIPDNNTIIKHSERIYNVETVNNERKLFVPQNKFKTPT